MIQRTYYERIGAEKLQQLIAGFYEGIREDEVLRPMYPGDLEAAERRLFLFMVQYLGGPATYSERRGHPRLRMRHVNFPIDEDARDRWLRHMKRSLDAIELDEESRNFLWSYFTQTADFLRNR
jgi:hemoglobin